jgi:hypothetical protein
MNTGIFSLPGKPSTSGRICILAALVALGALASLLAAETVQYPALNGPLRVHPTNPRYFTDGSGKAIYLTGSHTWNNLQEIARTSGPANPTFDFKTYLDFLQTHHHNCFRLWPWENAASFNSSGTITYVHDPMSYQRPGPGPALDGRPKFDLRLFNQSYFDRVRARVMAARDRGIYVAIMLFQGFSIENKGHDDPWRGHPFHRGNNINGIDGDPNADGKGLETHTLAIAAVTAFQEAYVRKVIDTVNDLDNVLYEITNEDTASDEDTAWQAHMINFIKSYETTKPRQHPTGMTVQWPAGMNATLFASPAEWISPNGDAGYQSDPPADARKVVLNDTDHAYFWIALKRDGLATQRAWVWKNFTRGNHTLFMDPYVDPTPWYVTGRNNPVGGSPDAYWDTLREAMGHTRQYALKMDLAAMTPQGGLSSTDYCLAKAGSEYLVYQPISNASFSVNLVAGTYEFEWFDPTTGAVVNKGTFTASNGNRSFTPPFGGMAVSYFKHK